MISALSCDGSISIAPDGAPLCSGMWVLTQVPEQFDPSTLDTVVLGQAFSVGFGLVATVLVGALGVKAVLDFIKTA
ncbi:hypothetical protein [Pseudomonas aeruginosa]|uniref:hypothetical protein n=1 Tax=Pseudomonas aeruginosa TaxID=287 RepID=UPI000F83A63C|nr:hypothetical protein [Pseudomonas aeruginosa]ELR9156401.1 hypothetical protein [Pseudomonas aeruginosa]RTV63006.1 hypothetical protein DY991_10060 [Pseudomonas aeruginosa]